MHHTRSRQQQVRFKKYNKLSAQYDKAIIHALNSLNEEKRIKDETKATSPVEYMDEIACWMSVVIAHGNPPSENDQKLLPVYQDPHTTQWRTPKAQLASHQHGICTVLDMRIGLGTDGPMSSNQVDIMRTPSYAATCNV
ncbi:hypothetical protein OK016_29405 [Vibrio chagasii]|nr:hypothetical protein [Vibrio chagasii]